MLLTATAAWHDLTASRQHGITPPMVSGATRTPRLAQAANLPGWVVPPSAAARSNSRRARPSHRP
jgi:hypothetical protein